MPTEAGEALVRFAEEVSALRAQFLSNLERMQKGSMIRLAMTHYAWLAYGNALEAAYKERRPDGQIDFGEKGIANVAVALIGVDDLGHAVNFSQNTNSSGAFVFLNLRPGTYSVTFTRT